MRFFVTPTGEQTREDIKDYLEAWVVSEELDKYYRDVYSFQNTNMDNLFNMVYASGDLISSNIKNGFGIFGAEYIIREQAISGYNW